MTKRFLSLLATLMLCVCASAQEDEQLLRSWIRTLASDEFGGRKPMTGYETLTIVNSCKRTVNPREDSSDFVAITDVVPDVILEIRYYGTYNFVGTRIDGYKAPTA